MRHVTGSEGLQGVVTIVGVPWDEHSSFLLGAAEGPGAIRGALLSPSTNLATEDALDLGTDPRFADAGDLEVPLDCPGLEAARAIERGATGWLAQGARLVALGGDHAVSYPLVRAHAAVHGPLAIVHLDAHPDLYDEFEGDRYSHACPFARILEDGLARHLVQVGIRTMNPAQRKQADRFGVEVIPMGQWSQELVLSFEGPVYVSVDLDVLDPAFAPGVSHHEPGGCSTRDVLRLIQSLRGQLVGADVVELNPSRDLQDVTARAAAKIVKELAARLLERY
jgi:agmatinase